MKTFKLYVEWAFSTLFGSLYQYSYCPIWDKKLNELIDAGDAKMGHHVLIFDNIEVWVSNRFYAYGHIYRSGIKQHRPSTKTMIRLAKLQDSLVKTDKDTNHIDYLDKMSKL